MAEPFFLFHDLIANPVINLHNLLEGIMECSLQTENLVFKSFSGLDMSLDLPLQSFLILLCTMGHLSITIICILMSLLLHLMISLQLDYSGSQSRNGVMGLYLLFQRGSKLYLLLQLS